MGNPLTDTPDGEPLKLVAGDTWSWKRTDLSSDFPTADYTLSYVARIEGGITDETITATDSGGEYLVSVAAAATAAYAAGRWQWTAFMTRDSDSARVKIADGTWIVEPDPASANTDPRSHAQTMLDAIEALLANRATRLQESYSIGNRSLSHLSPAELTEWRSKYRSEVFRERRAARKKAGKATGRTRAVRFSNDA